MSRRRYSRSVSTVVFIQWMVLLFLTAGLAVAQSPPPAFDTTHLYAPSPLDATWRIRAGDDPAFARADFDDSKWTPFKPTSDLAALYGSARPPIVWYRLRIKTDPAQKALALSENQIARAFEIYANGRRILWSGSVTPYEPYTSNAHVIGVIPDADVASGSVVIAIRAALAPAEWAGQFPGYYISNLTIGNATTLKRDDWLTVIGANALIWTDHLLMICLGLVALVLFASQRNQPTYLWIAAVGALTLLELPVTIIEAFRNLPLYWDVLTYLLRLFSPYLWASLYFSFVHQRMDWRWRTFLILAGIGNALTALQPIIFAGSAWFAVFGNLPFIVLLSVIVPIVLILHWRRGNREAGILLIPVILFSLYIYAVVTLNAMFQFPIWRAAALRGIQFINFYPVGPFAVSMNNVTGILGTVSLAMILLLRSTEMSRRQAVMESELAAAQQVQQVLVPEQAGTFPGFDVQSVYLPAQEVGGDFFQVLHGTEGGLLVVVGDVAGKGLPAAMLVSTIVGAVRATAEFTQDPAELLAHLNEQLVGRAGGGFATALVAHISPGGRVAIANAGHLSPYVDGKELTLPGALPLGLAPGTDYEITETQLAGDSRITFCSDGVIEAQNAAGELFGFDRSRAISTRSATEIAEVAMNFGQKDDITVVTIRREMAASQIPDYEAAASRRL